MKKPPKPGQKVAVYDGANRIVGIVTILYKDSGLVEVERKDGYAIVAHPNQCRVIKKIEDKDAMYVRRTFLVKDDMTTAPFDGDEEFVKVKVLK